MSCLSDARVSAYLRGELPSLEVGVVESHLDSCPECRELVSALGKARAVSVSLPTEPRSELAETTAVAVGSGPPAERLGTGDLAGRYPILREIGAGGMGVVYAAHDPELDREVALKLLRTDGAGRSRGGSWFLREARVTGQLEHPSIVPVHDIGTRADGTRFYTMKLIRGRTLAAAIQGCRSLAERLGLLPHFLNLCNAIAYAHSRGVLHRDVKPQNVMVGEFGETVVLDWGLAKIKGRQEVEPEKVQRKMELLKEVALGRTVEGGALGTPAYMPPEQAAGRLDLVDERSDVYSLGGVLYELLTARPPFAGLPFFDLVTRVRLYGDGKARFVPVRELAPAPPELAAIAHKALAPDRERRYASVPELIHDVEAYLAGRPVGAYRYSLWEKVARFVAAHRAVLSGVAVAFVAVIAALFAVTLSYRAEVESREREEAARAEESRQRLSAELRLSQAFQGKAESLSDEGRALGARIFAARSLEHNPARAGSPVHSPAFAAEHPESRGLVLAARSLLYRTQFDVIRGLRGAMRSYEALGPVAFSPDGSRIASASHGRNAEVWSVAEQRRLLTLEGHRDVVSTVAYSPDGKRIATASYDRTVRIWDATAGRLLRTFSWPMGHYAMAWAPDGRSFAVGAGKEIVLRDVEGERPPVVLRSHRRAVYGLAYSADGSQLASAGYDSRVILWDLRRNAARLTLAGLRRGFRAVAFSPDGKLVAGGGLDRRLYLWSTQDGKLRALIEAHRDTIAAVTFSRDGRLVVTASADRTVRFWDVQTAELRLTLDAHADGAYGVATSPDGRLLATSSFDKHLKLWDLSRPRPLTTLAGERYWVFSVAFSPDGHAVAAGVNHETVPVWDLGTGQVRYLEGHKDRVLGVEYSPKGDRLATACSDGTVRLWDAQSGRPLQVLGGHEQGSHGVAFSPDGTRLVAAAFGGPVRIWDVGTGRLQHTLAGHTASVWRVAWSPDGQLVASAAQDRTVRLWDARTGATRRILRGHTDWVSGVGFSPDGRTLASSGKDAAVILWDVASGEARRTLRLHDQWVNTVRFSPDGRLLASAGDDRRVVLWSAVSGEPLLVLRTAEGAAGAAFSPDGRLIAVGDSRVVRLYPLDGLVAEPDIAAVIQETEAAAGLRQEGFDLVIADR